MKTVVIHGVNDEILNLDLSEFDILTFDDGLYTQYKHYKHFLKFNKPMYFFISTALVSFKDKSDLYVTSQEAHLDWTKNASLKHFMSWKQIKEIESNELCHIGGHGCYHFDLRDATLEKQARISRNEVINMLNDFHDHDITINSFCFPYNHQALGYKTYLQNHGINQFFGSERTLVEDLL